MKKKLIGILLVLVVIVALGFYFLVLTKPRVLNVEEFSSIPRKKIVRLKIEHADKAQLLRVLILQNGKEYVVYEGKPMPEVLLEIHPKKLGLKEGEAEVVIELSRFYFLKEKYSIRSHIDYTPPLVNVVFSPYAVMNGGSGAVRVSVSEESDLKLSVKDLIFPFYKIAGNTYFSLFGVPIDFSPSDSIKIIAKDKVGNESVVLVPVRIRQKHYPVYKIELKGREKVLIPKLSSLLGEEINKSNFIQAFKKVNEDLRRENEEKISEIGKKSEERIYWSGKFLQLKNSKVVSLYGEKRIYTYGGKQISTSYHWGYDLASVKNSPVEASNSGRVVFTGFLGIYGNTVIIDHGYGLMSIYSHLAEFRVKEGDIVKKGQIIGVTDTTGLAFGDHLHFGIMINGLPVNPIEWWDKKWIKNNILPAIQSSTSR
ncbi:M23 family metallopeptidase [Aquifex aeolicus]|uniref:M23ase beta-sheet core domain-containing protein n=1 Tax=Aquifex aeolicus (strain VF5) TaxID=224324 RepID=O67629_AQUAE|nr:M23 family metallopeptidase [Aquifex aeolicus]AAC07601.1 hypothetical protein aq_1743 [Aquifex aeolicus VF5]